MYAPFGVVSDWSVKSIHLKTGMSFSTSIVFPPSFQKQAQTKRWKRASSDPARVWR